MPKPAIHQSSLAMLYRCPRQYEFRYVEGLRLPPNAFAAAGTAVHEAVRRNLAERMEHERLLEPDVVEGIAADRFLALWQEGVELSQEEREQGKAAVRERFLRRSTGLSLLHHAELAPGIEPTALEREWRLELQGYPYDLAGRMDIEEENSLRDTKTASRKPRQQQADESLQLTTYALAKLYTGGALPEGLYLDYLVDTKTPQAVVLQTTRTEWDVTLFLRRLEVAMRQLEAGVFPPTDPSNWWCSPRWCGYHERCPYV